MPPKKVDWLKGDVPQQRTIVRRTPAPAPQQQQAYPFPQPYAGTMQMQAPAQQQAVQQPMAMGTFTGAGVDGVVQPGKYAGMVEEGEQVIPANAAQAIPPHIFQALVQRAASGTLDVNALGNLVGVPTMQRYQTGTAYAGDVAKILPGNLTGTLQSQGYGTKITPSPASSANAQRSSGVPSSPTAIADTTPVGTMTGLIKAPEFKQPEYKAPAPIKLDSTNTITAQAPTVKAPEYKTPSIPTFNIQQPANVPAAEEQVQLTPEERASLYANPMQAELTPEERANFYANPAGGTGSTPSETVPTTTDTGPTELTTIFTDSTPTISSSTTGTAASNIVQKGLQNLSKQMDGMSDTDKKIANFYLSNTDATNSANLRVLASQISADPYMSPQAKQNAIAGLQRDMAADRGTFAGTLAIDAATRADAAQAQGIQLGQQVRTYEDITLPTSQQANEIAKRTFNEVTLPTSNANLATSAANLKTSDANLRQLEENLRQSTETYNNYQTPANKIALEAAQASLDAAKANQATSVTNQATKSIQDRIATLFASGSVSTAQSDTTLQGMVNTMLGGKATPDEISAEIKKQWAAFNEGKTGDFNVNAETLVGAAIDNEISREDTIANDSIRRNVAGANGLDMATDGDKISAAVGNLYDQLNKPENEQIYDKLMKTGYLDEFKYDTPDFKSDMLTAIGHLATSGLIDNNGKPLTSGVIDWPWNAPSTYFKYNDFNGNPVVTGTSTATDQLTFTGNGKDYLNANGQAVTNADATAAWDKLNSTEQESYFDNGKFNTEKFLLEKFPAVKRGDGSVVPIMNEEQYGDKIINDETFAAAVSKITTGFLSIAAVPDSLAVTEVDGVKVPREAIGASEFLYYDKYGAPHITDKSTGNFGRIVSQIAELKGISVEDMTPGQFSEIWKEGKPWQVDSNGNITNLNNKGVNVGLQLSVFGYKDNVQDGKPLIGSLEGAKYLAANFDDLPADVKVSGNKFLENNSTVNWDGSNWVVSTAKGADVTKWVDENIGKLYKFDDGRVYVVSGWHNNDAKGLRNNTGSVILYDYATGEKVEYSSGSGNSAKMPINGVPYA